MCDMGQRGEEVGDGLDVMWGRPTASARMGPVLQVLWSLVRSTETGLGFCVIVHCARDCL